MRMRWNPRYVAYSASQRLTPEKMLVRDTKMYPGGKMCGFMLWIRAQWARWSELPNHGGKFPGSTVARQEAHDDFDDWLAGEFR